MKKHPYFDLWLHDDAELAALIGLVIMERTTIHEWPLSCVQRLQCATGQRFIYKVQAPPTVEPSFYQSARSPLLAAARRLPDEGLSAAMVLEEVAGCLLGDLALDKQEKLAKVDEILAGIATIQGELPSLGDIRTPERWYRYGQALIADLLALVENRTFQQVTQTTIDQLAEQIRSPRVLTAISGPTGYLHNDLKGENVLVTATGYCILDWQRPFWGPVDLDRASLLESLGIDATPYVAPGILALRLLLVIGWFAQAARYWFPAGAPSYDRQIADYAQQLQAYVP
ncbi:MAG: phosphotransferase [Caldilineaceae bacterium]|nr:phosphotransferase [Caldilineaceae bacterium]